MTTEDLNNNSLQSLQATLDKEELALLQRKQ